MATTIRLRYGVQAKPVLADRDGEAVVNWEATGAKMTIAADPAHPKTGTNAFKLALSAEPSDIDTDNVHLDSDHNATFVVGRTYSVGFWAITEAACTLRVKTGGAAEQAFSITTSYVWYCYDFVAVTEATALQMQVDNADPKSVWIDDIIVTEAVILNVLSERGMSHADSFGLWPPLKKTFLDGSMKKYTKGFRRRILVDVGVVASEADQKQILYWMCDNDATVDYLTEVNVPMIPKNESGYENEWKYDCSLNRYYVFELEEPLIRTIAQGFPV